MTGVLQLVSVLRYPTVLDWSRVATVVLVVLLASVLLWEVMAGGGRAM